MDYSGWSMMMLWFLYWQVSPREGVKSDIIYQDKIEFNTNFQYGSSTVSISPFFHPYQGTQ